MNFQGMTDHSPSLLFAREILTSSVEMTETGIIDQRGRSISFKATISEVNYREVNESDPKNWGYSEVGQPWEVTIQACRNGQKYGATQCWYGHTFATEEDARRYCAASIAKRIVTTRKKFGN